MVAWGAAVKRHDVQKWRSGEEKVWGEEREKRRRRRGREPVFIPSGSTQDQAP